MPHAPLIATLACGLVAALLFGTLARRVGLPPIVGYLMAGIAVGPHTPGLVADAAIAGQLSEVGVILLMFGVGLHFSWKDLLAVWRVAVPGAIGQSVCALLLALLLCRLLGWGFGAGAVFGLALAVASTVVLIRGLTDAKRLDSPAGHVAVGWLIVEDLLTVLILVLLPALAPGVATSAGDLVLALGKTVAKVALLGAAMQIVGTRVVPWILVQVARARSRELFTLAVLAIALGIALVAAELFGVSMALGAFLAGLVVGQSDLSHQAAADALPFRDAFAVLFFVSVGMLFDPGFVLREPALVAAALCVVLLAKPLAASVIVLLLGHPLRTALTVAIGLAQIGEFSFILGALAVEKGLLPPAGQQALLAGAIVSITLNPLLFTSLPRIEARLMRWPWLARRVARSAAAPGPDPTGVAGHGHVLLIGHGRVGSILRKVLAARGTPHVVVEQDRRTVEQLRREGADVVYGDAANPVVLEHAGLARAQLVLFAAPDEFALRQVVAQAKASAPGRPIVARIHGEADRHRAPLIAQVDAVHGESELAFEMVRRMLGHLGISAIEAQAEVASLRRVGGPRFAHGPTRVVELAIPPGSPAAGKTLAELKLGASALVMIVQRDGELVVPTGATALHAGDQLFALADAEGRSQLEALLGCRAAV